MQLHAGPTAGLVGTARDMWVVEGVKSFTKGLGPAVGRAMIYGGVAYTPSGNNTAHNHDHPPTGLRLGLYAPIRDILPASDPSHPSLVNKLAAGALSGAVAAAATNPLDLVKTRLQVQGLRNASPIAVLRDLIATQGVGGLWRGTAAGATRAAVLTASQCATYDAAKRVCVCV